ncbi:MAG: zinc-ribbon domain-containing protein, partial [Beijerinckiaceae bacterium]|nr:zinc-ribbon domain-containing protein [Beijerinckiaceae bacterium]
MLIVCPTCASRYSIDDDKIGPEGRMVRCASCRADFFVAAPVTAADDAAPLAEAPRETQAAQAPQPAHAAPLAKTARRSADDDLAAAWLEEAGLEPDPPPEPEPVPEGAPLPAEPASAAPADQAALDALFEQELAA